MYFQNLPVVEYPNLEDSVNQYKVVLTNILSRSSFLREIMENTALFYDYQVKEGETAEIIADKLYGDPNRFWIVLLFNNLSNAYYDFPLITEQLNDLIEAKYGISLATAQSTIHHYEERVTHTTYYNQIEQDVEENIYTVSQYMQDPNTGLSVIRPSLPIVDSCIDTGSVTTNFGSGVTVVTSTKLCAISYYNYEFEENEKRRSIRLLDKDYVIKVENEFKRLMRDGR